VSEVSTCPGCGDRRDEGARCGHCGVAFRAGRWRVERVLAQSAHSRVYLASDEAGQRVALKELHFALVPSTQEVEAFEREAGMLATLEHPAIPRFVERFTEGTGVGLRLYLATEYVRGESLAQRLARGPLPEAEVLELGVRLLEVLCLLQRRSPAIFHRDLKPANVMFREDGAVVLVDFGSARGVEASRTHRSTLVGTFGYMPPEQLGGTVDRTSDVFALGATLLHAVTSRPPSELLQASMALAVPTSLSPRLRAWLLRALALDRARRFAGAREALEALRSGEVEVERIAPVHSGPRARPLVLASVLTALAALAGGLALQARGPRTEREPVLAPRPVAAEGPLRDESWFSRVRSGCNNLEVRGVMARTPPPPGADGAGDGAGCYALAARYDDARRLIEALPSAQERQRAAWRVFEISHPVADQGDDAAAGPMMELVLDFWPDNFQALYHAGIAEYAQGDTARAKGRLEDFLRRYTADDFFTSQARTVLERIARGQPPDPGDGLGRH
jgi:Protein kinase domain